MQQSLGKTFIFVTHDMDEATGVFPDTEQRKNKSCLRKRGQPGAVGLSYVFIN